MEKLEEYKWSVLKGLTMSLFFLYFFIKGRLLGKSEFYNLLDLTFGVYYYFLILYPLLLASSVLLGDKRRERVLRVRLYSGILFFFFCTFFVVMKELNYYAFSGVSLEEQLVKISWKEMNLGGAATSVMDLLYFNVNRPLLYKGVVSGIFISGFILLAKMVTEAIREIFRAISRQREREELEKKERELLEKISIKEEIDKKMNLKKQKSLKQQEEKIQQEVDKFIKEDEVKEESEKSQIISLDDLMNFTKSKLQKSPHSEEAEKKETSDETQNEAEEEVQREGIENDTSI